jgi:hypothetical protein
MTRLLLTPALLFLLAGCASVEPPPAPTATLAGDSARPARASGWLRSELYFGAGAEAKDGQATADAIDDVRWRAFLDAEVTPRFPDGLTVFEAYGQWRYRGEQEPERQRARVLVILHEDSPQHRADIEAIRLAWKRATGHQSVLWSRQPAEVSF